MFKLLIKYMLGLTLLAIVAVLALYWIANKIHERGTEQVMKAMHRGVFYSLQMQLEQYPEAQWPAIVKKLRPPYGVEASVVPFSELHLPKKKIHLLKTGEFIINSAGDKYFFGYGVEDMFSYQRIGHSNYVLELQDIPIQTLAIYVSAWMTRLLMLELAQTPRNEWDGKLRYLEKIYEVNLAVIATNDKLIPDTIKSTLHSHDFALSEPEKSNGQIKFIYVKLEDGASLLRIGPIPYPLYIQHQLSILIITFLCITLAFIILLTYIFSRNLEKIYRITEQYSKADFSTPPALSKHSTLRTLYDNILSMGHKIQNLLTSQRNLTRFVAHECRTPLTTMLFAIENLQQENLTEKAQKYIKSIREDLHDLDNLVSEFLNYARVSAQELTLNINLIDINDWLASCCAKYKDAPKKITLNSEVPSGVMAKFDPELMKHVINNLINNAIKHTRSQIEITLLSQQSAYIIQVDDDGEKIDDADGTNIFAPFVTLDSGKAGFGLGLYIADSIIKRHHGSIQLGESALGGSRFSIFLPN